MNELISFNTVIHIFFYISGLKSYVCMSNLKPINKIAI